MIGKPDRSEAGINRDRPTKRLPTGGAPLRVKMAREGIGLGGASDGLTDVPGGGTTGQVLTKASNADYDTEWASPSGGGWFPGGF